MTMEVVLSRLDDELTRTGGPVKVPSFLATFHPHDVEAGQLLERAFHVRLLRGRLISRLVKFDGYISAIVDRTRPVWH